MTLARIHCVVLVCVISSLASAAEFKFDFSTGTPQSGFTQVAPGAAFDPEKKYGFVATSADEPARFIVEVDEGNYDVTIRFGHPTQATSTTIKAESRRLMIEKVETKPGEFVTRTVTVNVHKPKISTGGETRIDNREKGPPAIASWDEYLNLEFNGKAPGVASVEIKPNPEALTVFVAGDSTVVDGAREPFTGWGQMLPRFFQQGVAVSNLAQSGLTLTSFERQKRLDKIVSMMKPGDYVLIQFGHNDQKEKGDDAGPFKNYKTNLKRYIKTVRDKGGIPVILSPMERRRWKDGEMQTTLTDHAEAVRQTAAEEKVPVIDLNTMSQKLYKALGETRTMKAFVFFPANTFPGQSEALKDNTHFTNYGAYEIARCVVEGIRANVPELAAKLSKDAAPFDPSHPDDPEKFDLPASRATGTMDKPAGS